MRWDRLFEDLEAQLWSDERHELAVEVADRTRRERALVDLHARLLANMGAATISVVTGAGAWSGRLLDVGSDWLLVEPRPDRPVLVPLAAAELITGLGPGIEQPSVVARRFGLGAALRAVSRDRAPVEITLGSGRLVPGTIDVVGADHFELAEHPVDELRRAENVRARHLVPFAALASVRRS